MAIGIPETNDHSLLAQAALRVVEKGIGFEVAQLGLAKAELDQVMADFGKLAF
jgi:hypothetical protein